ncbi:MAG: glycosyltransferase family 87 protein [Elusimicrobiales bacterium]
MIPFCLLCGFLVLLAAVSAPLAAFAEYAAARAQCCRDKTSKINTVAVVVLAGFAFCLIYLYTANQAAPFNTFLFPQEAQFSDYFDITTWHPPRFYYFPFGFAVVDLFVAIQKDTGLMYFLVIFMSFFVLYSWQYLKDGDTAGGIRNVIILSFFTFPFLFVMDRANFETFVYMFLALFLWFYRKNNTMLAAVFLGCAIAMKLFPAVFLVLFLADRKYREAALAAAMVPALWLLSLLTVPTFQGQVTASLARMLREQPIYVLDMIIGDGGLDFGHSFFGMLKTLLQYAGLNSYAMSASLMKPYAIFCLEFFAMAAVFVIWREKTLWKRVALLVLSMNALPFVSADYKLIHFFLPMYLYFTDDSEDKASPAYAVLFGLLLVPKRYYFSDIKLYGGNLIDPVLMLVMALLIMCAGGAPWGLRARLRAAALAVVAGIALLLCVPAPAAKLLDRVFPPPGPDSVSIRGADLKHALLISGWGEMQNDKLWMRRVARAQFMTGPRGQMTMLAQTPDALVPCNATFFINERQIGVFPIARPGYVRVQARNIPPGRLVILTISLDKVIDVTTAGRRKQLGLLVHNIEFF